MSSPNFRQNILGRTTPYSRTVSKLYEGSLSTTLNVQHEYQRVELNSIKIATEFFSDFCDWSYVGNSAYGDKQVTNVGTYKDLKTYNKTCRFESRLASTSHKIRSSVSTNYPNGYYPNLIYIGGHNLVAGDYIIFRAFMNSDFSGKVYELRIPFNEKDIFFINSYPFSKFKYYELEFVLGTSRVLSVSRIILAGTLPTNPVNNAQMDKSMGYKDYRESIVTESKTLLFNRKFFGKTLRFSIQVNLTASNKLSDQIQTLIQKGTGSKPFLVVLNPKDPNYQALYGIITEYPSFTQFGEGYGIYEFETEEFQ